MQNIVFYVDASKSIGTVKNITNNGNEYAPPLVFGISVCLKMRLFATSYSTDAYPISSFSGVTRWAWRMDSEFSRRTPYKVNADNENISVQTVTETVNGKTMSFTEFAIPISEMNTQELRDWLGDDREQAAELTGELVGYDSSGNAIFGLQVDGFAMRNNLADLIEPASSDHGYLTSSETELLVSSALAAKQDKLTSANAGAGIAIDSGGTISMACAILGAINGVKIVDGLAQFDPETAIGADGSTRGAIVTVADGLLVTGGTASIDDASVKDVLVGLEGGTASISDEVVTPGNLRGALSVGQAVDVSCKPYNNSGTIVYVNDDFLQGFTATMVAGTTVGFYDKGSHKFPKFAKDGAGNPRHYIFLMDVTGSGAITPNGQDSVTLSSSSQRISMEVSAEDTGFFSAAGAATVSVANWRQYEVNALTAEARDYLASAETNPDPDALFRSTSVYSVLNKYLVKQDMVAPWIPTISMPDNSDLTVAAGLSYKIKYTNDNAHKITVDTIPQDAYGWDAHIQMFIKGTSSIQFQPPLVLMDALTPNAGHNLSVKFRNGQALVYVEDTNAGYIVVSPTGSTDGTLAYGLSMTPVSASDDKYIIFGSTVNGLVCDFGTVTAVYGAQSTAVNVLGNGRDQTSISGTLTVPSGKTMNMQDLAVSGSTINGAGTLNLTDVMLRDDTMVDTSSAAFTGVAIPAGSTVFTDDHAYTLNSIVVDGVFKPGKGFTYGTKIVSGTGSIIGDGSTRFMYLNSDYPSASVSGVTVTGFYNATGGAFVVARGNLKIINCVITGNSASNVNYGRDIAITDTSTASSVVEIYGSTIGNIAAPAATGDYIIQDSTIDYARFYRSVCNISLSGTCKFITELYDWSGTCTVTAADNAILDLSAESARISNVGQLELGFNTTIKGTTSNGRLDNLVTVGKCTIDNALKFDPGTAFIAKKTHTGVWTAENVGIAKPFDASEIDLVQLSGNTFSSAAYVSGQPARMQFPSGSTNTITGINAAETKTLQAPVMVVGDNAASPSGSAFVVTSNGTASISGIGTWIDKEGDNDFRPVTSNFNVSNTASSGAGSLLDRLTSASAQATTSGMQQFVGFVSGGTQGVASAAANTAIVSTTILTKDYQPVFGGNYTVSSGGIMTVDQATKTTTVSGGIMTLGDVYIPQGATVSVSGGGLAIEKVTGNGGTIDLGGSYIDVTRNSASITGINFSSNSSPYISAYSATVELTSCTFAQRAGRYDYAISWNQTGGIALKDCDLKRNVLFGNIGSLSFSGFNKFGGRVDKGQSGFPVIVSSGATLDLTGTTYSLPLDPGGGITFVSGGATVLTGGTAGVVDAQYALDNVTLPAGAKLTNTAVIELGGTNIPVVGTATASGCTFSGGIGQGAVFFCNDSNGRIVCENVAMSGNSASTNGGAVLITSSATLDLTSCTLSGNTCGNLGGAVALFSDVSCSIDKCTIAGNSARLGGGVNVRNVSSASITNSLVSGNIATGDATAADLYVELGGTVSIAGCTIGQSYVSSGAIVLDDVNSIGAINGAATGSVTISSGAVIDLTGNTNSVPINPGGGIVVLDECTIINSAGESSTVTGGTYSTIEKNGTIND